MGCWTGTKHFHYQNMVIQWELFSNFLWKNSMSFNCCIINWLTWNHNEAFMQCRPSLRNAYWMLLNQLLWMKLWIVASSPNKYCQWSFPYCTWLVKRCHRSHTPIVNLSLVSGVVPKAPWSELPVEKGLHRLEMYYVFPSTKWAPPNPEFGQSRPRQLYCISFEQLGTSWLDQNCTKLRPAWVRQQSGHKHCTKPMQLCTCHLLG